MAFGTGEFEDISCGYEVIVLACLLVHWEQVLHYNLKIITLTRLSSFLLMSVWLTHDFCI